MSMAEGNLTIPTPKRQFACVSSREGSRSPFGSKRQTWSKEPVIRTFPRFPLSGNLDLPTPSPPDHVRLMIKGAFSPFPPTTYSSVCVCLDAPPKKTSWNFGHMSLACRILLPFFIPPGNFLVTVSRDIDDNFLPEPACQSRLMFTSILSTLISSIR